MGFLGIPEVVPGDEVVSFSSDAESLFPMYLKQEYSFPSAENCFTASRNTTNRRSVEAQARGSYSTGEHRGDSGIQVSLAPFFRFKNLPQAK